MKITVYTPVFNKADKLDPLFESLKEQTYRNFEWLIIDDGSQDGITSKSFKYFADANNFRVRYFNKTYGGRHTAFNFGLEKAEGDAIITVDADEILLPDALEKADNFLEEAKNSDKIIGIALNKLDENSNPKGTSPKEKYTDIKLNEKEKYNITGNKTYAFYIDKIRKFPMPMFYGEFCFPQDEYLDSVTSAEGYKVRFLNDACVISPDYKYEWVRYYDPAEKLMKDNPKGYGKLYSAKAAAAKSKSEKASIYSEFRKMMKSNYSDDEIASFLGTDKKTLKLSSILGKK